MDGIVYVAYGIPVMWDMLDILILVSTETPEMSLKTQIFAIATIILVTAVVPHFTALPQTAEESINKDRIMRQASVKTGNVKAVTPKWGFFGTIFNLILEQVNDTKSAYNQISDLVSSQFSDGNANPVTASPSNNGSTVAPKITRAEFLQILDRNLKGLARLRDLETRIAKKDSMGNLRAYKEEIFRKKKS